MALPDLLKQRMDRRTFLTITGTTALGLLFTACAPGNQSGQPVQNEVFTNEQLNSLIPDQVRMSNIEPKKRKDAITEQSVLVGANYPDSFRFFSGAARALAHPEFANYFSSKIKTDPHAATAFLYMGRARENVNNPPTLFANYGVFKQVGDAPATPVGIAGIFGEKYQAVNGEWGEKPPWLPLMAWFLTTDEVSKLMATVKNPHDPQEWRKLIHDSGTKTFDIPGAQIPPEAMNIYNMLNTTFPGSVTPPHLFDASFKPMKIGDYFPPAIEMVINDSSEQGKRLLDRLVSVRKYVLTNLYYSRRHTPGDYDGSYSSAVLLPREVQTGEKTTPTNANKQKEEEQKINDMISDPLPSKLVRIVSGGPVTTNDGAVLSAHKDEFTLLIHNP